MTGERNNLYNRVDRECLSFDLMDWRPTDPDDAEGSAYLITQAIYWLWRGVKALWNRIFP
jgi:hypothetical protein